MRKKLFGAGNIGAAEPEGRQNSWFDSLGWSRVIGAQRKRVAQAARQGNLLCAAKSHVCFESGIAAGHTDAGSVEASRAGWQRSHGGIGLSNASGRGPACNRRVLAALSFRD